MNFRNKLTVTVAASVFLTSSTFSSISVLAAETPVTLSVVADYTYSVFDDAFDFSDHVHKINILNAALKNGRDISYYGLNDEGNLAVVYFNTERNQGKGVVASNDSMTYITYSNGQCTEINRKIGTFGLFEFDMSNADRSLPGMMNVFNASLGSFLKGYGATVADYSARCSTSVAAGDITYIQGRPTSLLLMDDNYITNPYGSANETFLANEWGIYSGYQVVNNVDYNTFCFFGDCGDLYLYGYAPIGSGFNVLAMKGIVSRINERVQSVDLLPVDLSVASDDASQYVTKMAGCLMAAQGVTGLNLDTLKLEKSISIKHFKLSSVIKATTSTASGILQYQNGVYVGTLTDENGNTEELTVQANGNMYVVKAQKTGIFTVSCNNGKGSLAEYNPADSSQKSNRFSLRGLLLDWVFTWIWF